MKKLPSPPYCVVFQITPWFVKKREKKKKSEDCERI